MAQTIVLRRSAQPGKIPDTGSLNLGELAINTYDGKIFFAKSGSSNTIEQIITTDAAASGSITIYGTGSFDELNVTKDIQVNNSLYVVNDIVGNGDLDVLGSVSGSELRITGTGSFESLQVNDTLTVNHGTTIISGSFLVNGTEVGVAAGPNTFDFNLDPEAAGTVNFIEDSSGNTQAVARTGSFDVTIANNTYLSISSSAMNVTTGSITANYMHLAKYITTSGALDFNI